MKTKILSKKRMQKSLGVCLCVGLLAFAGGCSSVRNTSRYSIAYENYLSPYILVDEENGEDVAFKFVNKKSVVVSVGETAYPCYVEAKDKDSFVLTCTEQQENSPNPKENQEEKPSVFYLDFWEDKATVSFSVLGVEVQKMLSVSEELGVPVGTWKLFATQNGDDGELDYENVGGGWTVVLENGDSYAGEGYDSAWITKFVSVGDRYFQCLFDSKSGVILDASILRYDETTFDYPVMVERYLSDSRVHYFYSRLLQEEEKTEFKGGEFTSGAVTYEAETGALSKEELPHDSFAKWKVAPQTSKEETELDVAASLSLNSDGSVLFKADGRKKYDCAVAGKWYPLEYSVLVVLEEKTALIGNVFTVYVSTQSNEARATEGDYLKKAKTYYESYSYDKVWLGKMNYYMNCETVQIYWGSDYANGNIRPQLLYERKYVLNALWFEPFYMDEDFGAKLNEYEKVQELTPFPLNGEISLIFHENGTFDIIYEDGTLKTVEGYQFIADRGVVEWSSYDKVVLYDGVRNDVSFDVLNVGHNCLYIEVNSGYYKDGKNYTFKPISIRFVLAEE